jgi:hypothetical protein
LSSVQQCGVVKLSYQSEKKFNGTFAGNAIKIKDSADGSSRAMKLGAIASVCRAWTSDNSRSDGPDDEDRGFVDAVLILGHEKFTATLLNAAPGQAAGDRQIDVSVRPRDLTFLR